MVAKLEAPPNVKGESERHVLMIYSSDRTLHNLLVPVEVPPPGTRLLPKMGVAEGGFCENMGALLGWDAPPKLNAGPDEGPPNETDC